MLKFGDPLAVAKLDAAIVKRRAAGTLTDKNRGNWAILVCIPYPPSDEAMSLAAQVFDAGARYGTSSSAFTTAAAEADKVFATLKPGWLGSILAPLVAPVVIGISSFVGLEAVGALAGAGSAITTTAKTIVGDPLQNFTSSLTAPTIAPPTLKGLAFVAPPSVSAPTPAEPAQGSNAWLIAGGLVALALLADR